MTDSLLSDRNRILIAPSLMCADLSRLAGEVDDLDRAGADLFHFDIMDGDFVPNLTFGPVFLESLRRHSKKPFMAHLLIKRPLEFIEPVASAGADIIIFHVEAEGDPLEIIEAVRGIGALPGLALRPDTDPSKLFPYLHRVVTVTVLAVPPGFAGGPFMPEAVPRVETVHRECLKRGLHVAIVADGHIDQTTIKPLAAAGARIFVAGTAGLFKTGADYARDIDRLRQAAESAIKG